jgi:hypothetical protein
MTEQWENMSEGEPEGVATFEARHAAIIARTLSWADAAAARSDYRQTVHWVQTIRGLGHDLSDEYAAKRETWLDAIDPDRRSAS